MKRRIRDERPADLVQHVAFRVGGDEYALALLSLTEIVRLEGVVAAPKANEALLGLMSLRGERVPVLDLSAAFGRGRTTLTAESCVLMVPVGHDDAKAPLGLAVDGVSRVLDLAPAEIAAPPRLGGLLAADFIQAMARVEAGLVPILDVERLLASGELREAVAAARVDEAPEALTPAPPAAPAGPEAAAVASVPAEPPADPSPAIDPPHGGGRRSRRRSRMGANGA